ncbi:Uncharacterised protein [Acinetobacter baumannii]|nr:Uncharacterised protein [Acinetobacter baumannii]
MLHYLQAVVVAMHKNETLNSTKPHEKYRHFVAPQVDAAVTVAPSVFQSLLIGPDNVATIHLNSF